MFLGKLNSIFLVCVEINSFENVLILFYLLSLFGGGADKMLEKLKSHQRPLNMKTILYNTK